MSKSRFLSIVFFQHGRNMDSEKFSIGRGRGLRRRCLEIASGMTRGRGLEIASGVTFGRENVPSEHTLQPAESGEFSHVVSDFTVSIYIKNFKSNKYNHYIGTILSYCI